MVHRSGPGKNEGRGGKRRRRTNSWSRNEKPKPRRSRSDAERFLEVPIPPQRSTTVFSDSTDSQLHNGPYPYRTLNRAGEEQQFRLLTLYPGSGAARITCTLAVTNLQNPRRSYVALSYVWAGAPNNCQRLNNNRQRLPLNHIDIDSFQVFVEDNLYNALHHLRRPDRPRVFWIDALCINQDNLEERRHQVGLMKSIYENAKLVIAWIGDHEQGSLRVMTLADRISKFFGRTLLDQRVSWARRRHIDRPEIERTINSADRFVDLSRLRGTRGNPQNPTDRSLHSLEKLLFQHWNAAAKDPRDKVYSMFSMASDGDYYDIVVDYGEGITATELFTDIVKQSIGISGSLSIILPRRRRNETPHLPSWVPDWSSTTPDSERGNWADAYPFQVSPDAENYQAALLGRAIVRYSRGSMLALGFRLDEVRTISQNRREPLEIETRPSLFDWVPQFLSFLCFNPQPKSRDVEQRVSRAETWYIIFRRSLRTTYRHQIHNRIIPRENVNERSFSRFCRVQHIHFFWILHRATNVQSHERPHGRQTLETEDFLRWWREHRDIPDRYTHDLDEEMTPDLRSVCRSMGPVQINENYTNFFVTREGYLGLGPARMEPRDRICLLYGCDVPVVLRWEGLRNVLVGQCYVAGAMFGEAFERRRMRDEEFEIC
ncbi:hypothetical protein IFR05_002081 [Cadophora sp. M221]|nr:hypothetical protein IFR05_002081 [Cadophora sp. M221]